MLQLMLKQTQPHYVITVSVFLNFMEEELNCHLRVHSEWGLPAGLHASASESLSYISHFSWGWYGSSTVFFLD